MIPVRERSATAPAAAGFLPFGQPVAPRPSALPTGQGQGFEMGMGALLRFRSLMAAEGLDVQLARLCADRLYAFECFARAHAAGGEPLRRLALELFQIHHRRGLPAGASL